MYEIEFINSRELATLVGYSLKWVEKHRRNIVGAYKIGGRWKYNLQLIRQHIVTGKDILIKNK